MTSGSPIGVEKLNDDVAWEDFDPQEYIKHNYLVLHPDDEAIISVVRDHFSRHFRDSGGVPSGIDVGTGPNLYPALSMLPWQLLHSTMAVLVMRTMVECSPQLGHTETSS